MNNQEIKCSFKTHSSIKAKQYCQECKVYLCDKCLDYHKGLFDNHHKYNLNEDIKEIFTGFCNHENHYEYKYFCKNHNELCCSACITKIKGEGNGQHNDCEICFIKEIEDEKRNKLKDNIKILEELSNSFKQSINEIKLLFEKLIEDKETLKKNVQNIFTKFRNALNEREEQILLEIDNKINELYIDEDLIKKSEKLPSKINKSLEKGKKIVEEWNSNNDLKSIIYDCINIEKNIENINEINEKIKKCKLNNNIKGKISIEENEINENIESIKKLKMIYFINFKFQKCPLNISDGWKYVVSGEEENILTKTGSDGWMGTICQNILEKNINKWKIKILSPQKKCMVGVAPIDFDINSSSYNNCGWYFHSYGSLYSGPPHNYNGTSHLTQAKDEIIVVMNKEKQTLKFIVDNVDKGDSYNNIPLDKPIVPAVFLKHKNASVKIIGIID